MKCIVKGVKKYEIGFCNKGCKVNCLSNTGFEELEITIEPIVVEPIVVKPMKGTVV